jgi:hypothetical protein
VLLLALAVGGYFFWQSLDKDRDDGDDEDEVVESRAPKDEEDDAETPEPEPTPTPEPPQITLLHDMGYLGDAAACRMTAEQARAISGVISQTQGGVVMAAIFDGGDGVPILWVASADAVKPQNDENTVILTGHYQDKIYGFGRGSLAEYDWMTTLLQASSFYEENEPRGEYVLVIAGRDRRELTARKQEAVRESMTLEEHMQQYLDGGMDRKEAMKAVARDRGMTKRDVYAQLLEKPGETG